MKPVNNLTVRCPKCGHEYHLAELAMPGELIGSPSQNGIVKDPLGKIIVIDWDEEPTSELEYTCDNCDKKFIVQAKITLSVKDAPEAEDFSTLSSSIL